MQIDIVMTPKGIYLARNTRFGVYIDRHDRSRNATMGAWRVVTNAKKRKKRKKMKSRMCPDNFRRTAPTKVVMG